MNYYDWAKQKIPPIYPANGAPPWHCNHVMQADGIEIDDGCRMQKWLCFFCKKTTRILLGRVQSTTPGRCAILAKQFRRH